MQRIHIRLLTILLLLTFVGQAVASVAMNCAMPHMAPTHAHSHSDASMAHHTAAMMDMDCCEDETLPSKHECSCPVSACSAYSMLSIDAFFIASVVHSEKVLLPLPQNHHHLTSSLYRPPMFA
ncbi:hypothetical protein [Pseudoalteromonas sp.]|uniref:hypothetical protein n=1 Tax=Pseudoalteromonas sp. TaxID=53249 RepID=UPI00356A1316